MSLNQCRRLCRITLFIQFALVMQAAAGWFGLPQTGKLPSPLNIRMPERQQSLGSFQAGESLRLLGFLLEVDEGIQGIGSFQDRERLRLKNFQRQEKFRLQVEAHALESFQ